MITDRALLGSGNPDRGVFEPARIPGHGSVPAPVARAWLREGLDHPDNPDAADGRAGGAGAGAENESDHPARTEQLSLVDGDSRHFDGQKPRSWPATGEDTGAAVAPGTATGFGRRRCSRPWRRGRR